MIRDAGDEQLFPLDGNGGRAAEILRANGVEVAYEVIPGIDRYGIYFDGYDKGSKDALDWFERHL